MFSKILIANRGEVAVRIIRACREMGISTVAVYSEADKDALHVALADESYCIGSSDAAGSYLSAEKIISAAMLCGVKAIHPGYGFLSENANFARHCKKNGIVFIGPDPDSMDRLGDKVKLKEMIADTELEVIPGTGVLESVEEAMAKAQEIGYPVMLKACAGGGGKGIRLVEEPTDMHNAWRQVTLEADASFGDDSIYLEKYVFPARHIELQMIADEAGNVVCLGERDCSIQSGNQKYIEEAPSPAVDCEARETLIAKACRAVASLGYTGAGTLEFLLDEQGNFWFMEMNVRLQVEHCVTEMLTDIDIVKWQIRIAAGLSLDFKQEEVGFKGTAIECRINAKGCGKVQTIHVPGGPGVRVDSYLIPGTEIAPYYDSLLGKLIVYGKSREEAVRKIEAALCELIIEGIDTNIEEQLENVRDRRFVSGSYNLTFMNGRG